MVELAIWHQLLALALTKKVAAVTIAYLYGIPRLYRRSQKAVRYLAKDPRQRQLWAMRVRTSFRFPGHVLRHMHIGGATAAPKIAAPLVPGLLKDVRTPAKMYSFASSPLMTASKLRLQARMAQGRQHWQNAADELRDRGSAMQQRLFGRMRAGTLNDPMPDAAAMSFLRRARQAYNFVPAIIALP